MGASRGCFAMCAALLTCVPPKDIAFESIKYVRKYVHTALKKGVHLTCECPLAMAAYVSRSPSQLPVDVPDTQLLEEQYYFELDADANAQVATSRPRPASGNHASHKRRCRIRKHPSCSTSPLGQIA
jgi:hypothetical protein